MLATSLRRHAKKLPRTGWLPAIGTTPIITPTQTYDNDAVIEPSVLYESGTWKMWYGGWHGVTNVECINYATCTGDPTVAGNWTKYAGNPVVGSSSSGLTGGPCVAKVGSTYYIYYFDAAGGGNIKVATSTDGISWGTASTALSKTAAAWVTGWTNVFVWNEGGTTWKMLVEGPPSAGGAVLANISYATSTDGLSWTPQGTGFVTGLVNSPGTEAGGGGPWLSGGGAKVNGRYQMWLHGSNVAAWSDIYHAYSTDAQNWTVTSPAKPEMVPPTNGTVTTSSTIQQAADPCVVEVNGTSYLFHSGVNNNPTSGNIYVATYPGPIADLVLWEA